MKSISIFCLFQRELIEMSLFLKHHVKLLNNFHWRCFITLLLSLFVIFSSPLIFFVISSVCLRGGPTAWRPCDVTHSFRPISSFSFSFSFSSPTRTRSSFFASNLLLGYSSGDEGETTRRCSRYEAYALGLKFLLGLTLYSQMTCCVLLLLTY